MLHEGLDGLSPAEILAVDESSPDMVGKVRLKMGEGLAGWVAMTKEAAARMQARFLSNVDGHDFQNVIHGLDPRLTPPPDRVRRHGSKRGPLA